MSAPTRAAAGEDTRTCRLYRFIVLDPHTDYTTKTVGYIGETIRMPFTRLLEHVYEQPWADTIVGWEVYDEVYACKGDVLAAEEAAVRAELPLFNIEYNMANPRRVKPWEAKEQALDRQRRGIGTMSRPSPRLSEGKPVTASVRRSTPPSAPRETTRRPVRQPRATAVAGPSGMRLWTERAWFWWLVLWALVAGSAGVLAHVRLGFPGDWSTGLGAASASVVVGVLLPAKRRRRRRS